MTRTAQRGWRRGWQVLLVAAGVWAAGTVWAQDRSINDWIERLHEASRRRAYMGTFVVSTGGEIAASRIWHVCDGSQQVERIETLSGTPRITLRRNDEVVTVVPESRVAYREKREALRLFPDILRRPGAALLDSHYSVRPLGLDRVAGFDALVQDVLPRDALRYAYRVWTEKQTGLVVKLQTRDEQGQVVEQVAFTELQLDAPVRMDTLLRQMDSARGALQMRPAPRKTTPQAEGWRLKQEVAGFQPVSCHARGDADGPQPARLHCVFSDGLASVSVFLETFDPQRHTKEKMLVAGATHTVARRLGEHWVTAVGEVPAPTLLQFVQSLERTR